MVSQVRANEAKWRCLKCRCWMQVLCLDKRVECASCGSRALEKTVITAELLACRDLHVCHFCTRNGITCLPAGELCRMDVSVSYRP